MKDNEKKPDSLEIRDPKPPVIHSGRRVAADNARLMVSGYPTYPDCVRFDTATVNSD